MSSYAEEPQTLVNIETGTNGLYNFSDIHLGNGGAIRAFGMGKPFFEPVSEDKALFIDNGFIASISAASIVEKPDGPSEIRYSKPIDFITPQGVAWTGLALMALSSSVERSVKKGTIDHQIPVHKKLQELALSIVSVDTETRYAAQVNPYFMPEDVTNLALIPPEIPKYPEETVNVHLYINKQNKIEISPTDSNVEVGKIRFSTRKIGDPMPLPLEEVFNRAYYEVESNQNSSYMLRVLTGSRVSELDMSEELPNNVRHLHANYGAGM